MVEFKLYTENWAGVEIEEKDSYVMETKIMYRGSEFTKNPRGRLHLSVQNTSNEKIDFRIEFKLGNQRICPLLKIKDANDDIKKLKEFTKNTSILDTYNVYETLTIEFISLDGNLIGQEFRDISALVLSNNTEPSDQYDNNINIDMRRFNLEG